jgi:hypothetical protein
VILSEGIGPEDYHRYGLTVSTLEEVPNHERKENEIEQKSVANNAHLSMR